MSQGQRDLSANLHVSQGLSYFLSASLQPPSPVSLLVFSDRVSLCTPVCSRTRSVDQAGLKLRDTPSVDASLCWD